MHEPPFAVRNELTGEYTAAQRAKLHTVPSWDLIPVRPNTSENLWKCLGNHQCLLRGRVADAGIGTYTDDTHLMCSKNLPKRLEFKG